MNIFLAPRRPLIPAPYRQPERWPDDYYRPRRPEIDRRYDSHSYDYGNRPNTKRRGGKYLSDTIIWDVLCVKLPT